MNDCASELLEKMLIDILYGIIDKKVLYTLTCACLAISVKLIGAYDWVEDSRIFPSLIEEAKASGKSVDKRKLNLMEKDILARTGWTACSSIDKLSPYTPPTFELIPDGEWLLLAEDGTRYDSATFDDLGITEATIKVNESIINDIAEDKGLSIDQTREWIVNRVLQHGFGIDAVQLQKNIDTDHLTLIFEDKWYLLTSSGDRLDNEEFIKLGIKKASVAIRPKALRAAMKSKGLQRQEALVWIKDRVLGYGFELDDVQIIGL